MSRRRVTVAVLAPVALSVLVHGPASAAAERMQLDCGELGTIERSNGSSWWGVDDGAVYVSERIDITGGATFSKQYGRKGPDADRSTCVAEHFGSTWTVVLVRVR